MEKAYEDTLSSISEKEVLMGTVVGMNKKEVVINIGYKSEGVVPISEFRYKPDLRSAIRWRSTSRSRRTAAARWS
jgi:small subunit ribosomal protein S1